jgi:hypothetical protein
MDMTPFWGTFGFLTLAVGYIEFETWRRNKRR